MCNGCTTCPLDAKRPPEMTTTWYHWPEGAIKLHEGTGADHTASCPERARPGRDDPVVKTIAVFDR